MVWYILWNWIQRETQTNTQAVEALFWQWNLEQRRYYKLTYIVFCIVAISMHDLTPASIEKTLQHAMVSVNVISSILWEYIDIIVVLKELVLN